MSYSSLGGKCDIIERHYYLLVIIVNRFESGVFAFDCFFIEQQICTLHIDGVVAANSNKIDLFLFYTANVHVVTGPKEFEVDQIFEFVSCPVSEPSI